MKRSTAGASAVRPRLPAADGRAFDRTCRVLPAAGPATRYGPAQAGVRCQDSWPPLVRPRDGVPAWCRHRRVGRPAGHRGPRPGRRRPGAPLADPRPDHRLRACPRAAAAPPSRPTVRRRLPRCGWRGYFDAWRKARTHGETTGINVEHQFRLHVYSDPDNPGRSRRGGPAIGHHKLHDLAKRPSLCQQWIAGMALGDVHSSFVARIRSGHAQEDGQRPLAGRPEAGRD
jgi:hypothetical protein